MVSRASRNCFSELVSCTSWMRLSQRIAFGRKMGCCSAKVTGVDDQTSVCAVPPVRSYRCNDDVTEKSAPVKGIRCETRMSPRAVVCCTGRKIVVPSGWMTGVMVFSYTGAVPCSESCGRLRAPKASSRARAASRVATAARDWKPCFCAMSTACCSVSPCCAPAADTATIRKPRAESREPRAEHREPRAESRILFVPQTDNGVLARRAIRGHDAEQDAHRE
jgi:hypothetical protein